MPKKLAIFANKAAGRGNASELIREARKILWGRTLEFFWPISREELEKFCASLTPEAYEAAIVIGGDGTVNHAIRGLSQSLVPLCIFPGGTANDLAAELGIERDWNQIQWMLDQNSLSPMDLISVNGISFATVAGIGVGALLTAEFNEKRSRSTLFRGLARRLHSQVYTFLSAKTVLLQRNFFHHLHVKADIFDEKLKTGALFVCNQARLGGDLKVAPAIDNNDKRFSVLIVPRSSSLSLIQGLVAMKRGQIPKDFISFSTSALRIRSTQGKFISVFGDGETLVASDELEFKLLPDGLKVYHLRKSSKSGGGGL